MIVNKTYQIESCDDMELKIKRESLLEFRLTYDDDKDIKAIVFITPGLGGDADSNYREHLAEYVAMEFGVAVVSTNYHCIGNRPQVGSTFFLDEIDRPIFLQRCSEIGLNLDGDMSVLQDHDNLMHALSQINEIISDKKAKNELKDDFCLQIPITVKPTKNEYQNFGVMQGLDLLNALLFIKHEKPFKINGGGYEKLPVIMIGSSHGGYVSLMAAKMAPWLVDGVIENSAYAIYPWQSIGFGKEVDYTKYFCFCAKNIFKNINLFAFDRTLWTLQKNSYNYFDEAREEIRNILNEDALKIQANHTKQIYVSYHYSKDHIALFEHKKQMLDILSRLGFDTTLHEIKDENDVDGKFIKRLTHGMDMSIKSLINKELKPMLDKIAKNTKNEIQKREISYKIANTTYRFYQSGIKLELEIYK